jgi:hypothetical protein
MPYAQLLFQNLHIITDYIISRVRFTHAGIKLYKFSMSRFYIFFDFFINFYLLADLEARNQETAKFYYMCSITKA